MSLFKIVGEKLPPSQRSSLEINITTILVILIVRLVIVLMLMAVIHSLSIKNLSWSLDSTNI